MCLDEEFFIKRAEALRKYELRGEMDLDSFLEKYSLSEEELVDANILQEKELLSTVLLSNYELSETGKKYLREVKLHQLILLKKSKVQDLLTEINQQRSLICQKTNAI